MAYCVAGDNDEAIAIVDCLGENLDDCVTPYVCYEDGFFTTKKALFFKYH